MKNKKTHLKWISYVLLVIFVNLQVSPAWANEPAGNDEEGGDSGDNKGGDKGDPVDTRSGNNFFTERDFSFNTPGVSLEFSRKYNSIETYDSPMGPGWSHSMDWRLHEAREIICKVVPPLTNANFKVNLWEGTQLLADGQSYTNSVLQTNALIIIPEFYYGAPIKEPVDAYVEQPGGKYSIDLDELAVYGSIGEANPEPITSLEDMSGNPLSTNGITYTENTWLEIYEANGNSTRFWDNDTNGTWWASDKNWRIIEDGVNLVLHLPGGIQRVFNADGRMTRYQNGWGRGVTFTYSSGLLQRAEHDNGQAIQFSYTGTHVSGIDAGADLDMAYTYTNGLLETVILDLGTEQHNRSYGYTDGILTKKINPVGHEFNFSYVADANGKLTHKANAGYVDSERWLVQSLVYRSETLTDFTSHSRGLNLLERMAYSSKTGKLTDNFGPGIGNVDAETRGIHYAYNSAGDKTEETLFDDNISETFSTFTDYDYQHNPTTNSVAYNTTGKSVLAIVEWNKNWMLPSSIFDAEGNQVEMLYKNASISELKYFYTPSNSYDTTYGYYAGGLLSSVTNANNHRTQYIYDSRGYQTFAIPAAGPKLATEYDSNGNLKSIELLPEGSTNGTGRIILLDYNALGWLISIEHADGLGVTNKYNGLGYLTNTVDRLGRATDYTYAPRKKLTSMTQYLEHGGSNIPVRISFEYDEWLNTVTITEPRGRYVESYRLDFQNRVTSITNIENQVMNIEYGADDFIRKISQFDGSSITNTYDATGRINTVLYRNIANQLVETIDYDFDVDGELNSIADDVTGITNGYDILNRLVSVTSSVSSVISVVNYQYDPLGNVTKSAVNFGELQASLITYSYDADERLKDISTIEAGVFEYVYNPTNGRVTSVSNTVNGIITSYAYDLLDRTTNISYSAWNGSLIRSLGYDYDVAGMITNKIISGGATFETSYEYDSIYRLVEEIVSENSTPLRHIRYNYDLADNRTSIVFGGTTNIYTLGTGNRLASWGSNGSALYDSAGNTTNLVFNGGPELSLGWDERYRLVNADGASSSVVYGYDVLDRMISRTVGSDTEYYIYDGNHIVADVDASGGLLRSYSYGLDIDSILSMTSYGVSGTNTYYYLKDHQNTVIALADESGVVIESYDYDAYGKVTVFNASRTKIEQSAVGNRYAFQGRRIDWETYLMYFRARWYNPETGRWLSKDPIGISGGLNLYAFCQNNPVYYIDPDGLENRSGPNAGGVNNQSENPVNVYSPEDGTETVPPGGSSSKGKDWDSVESPAGSGNWEKIGPGKQKIDKNGNIKSNIRRKIHKKKNPNAYKKGSFPVPPKKKKCK